MRTDLSAGARREHTDRESEDERGAFSGHGASFSVSNASIASRISA